MKEWDAVGGLVVVRVCQVVFASLFLPVMISVFLYPWRLMAGMGVGVWRGGCRDGFCRSGVRVVFLHRLPALAFWVTTTWKSFMRISVR